jgi:hypothetical protein
MRSKLLLFLFDMWEFVEYSRKNTGESISEAGIAGLKTKAES